LIVSFGRGNYYGKLWFAIDFETRPWSPQMSAVIFVLVGLLMYAFAGLLLSQAESAIHEIEAGVCAIVGTLFIATGQMSSLCGMAIKEARERHKDLSNALADLMESSSVIRGHKDKEMDLRRQAAAAARAKKTP
jgi:hypothetical protein